MAVAHGALTWRLKRRLGEYTQCTQSVIDLNPSLEPPECDHVDNLPDTK